MAVALSIRLSLGTNTPARTACLKSPCEPFLVLAPSLSAVPHLTRPFRPHSQPAACLHLLAIAVHCGHHWLPHERLPSCPKLARRSHPLRLCRRLLLPCVPCWLRLPACGVLPAVEKDKANGQRKRQSREAPVSCDKTEPTKPNITEQLTLHQHAAAGHDTGIMPMGTNP